METKEPIMVECPQCHASFPFDEGLKVKLVRQEHDRHLAELQEREAKVRAESAAERAALLARERSRQAAELEAARVEARRQALEAGAKAALDAKRVREEQAALAARLRSEAELAQTARAHAEQEAIAARAEAQRRATEFEGRQKSLELEVAQKTAEGVKRLEQDILARIRQEEALKREAEEEGLRGRLKEQELVNSQLQDQIRKLKAPGSQQVQGEAAELVLEDLLRNLFAQDQVTPIGKGVEGSDVVQEVRGSAGRPAGRISWESKRTKEWRQAWIPRLKEVLLAQNADVGVVVTEALPKDFHEPGFVDGIWVTRPRNVRASALLIRARLLAVAEQRVSVEGAFDKKTQLYAYMLSEEFKQRIAAISDAFLAMERQIAQERRAFHKQWKQREKYIERAIKATAEIAGSILGIAGGEAQYLAGLGDVGLLGSGAAGDADGDEDDEGDEEGALT